jgi:hypothetical protein
LWFFSRKETGINSMFSNLSPARLMFLILSKRATLPCVPLETRMPFRGDCGQFCVELFETFGTFCCVFLIQANTQIDCLSVLL